LSQKKKIMNVFYNENEMNTKKKWFALLFRRNEMKKFIIKLVEISKLFHFGMGTRPKLKQKKKNKLEIRREGNWLHINTKKNDMDWSKNIKTKKNDIDSHRDKIVK